MTKNNVIEINGKHYDAHSGERIMPAGQSVPSASPNPSIHKKPSDSHLRRHAPLPSKLLMRQAVKKPIASAKPALKVNGTLPHKTPLSDLAVARRAERRLVHSKQIYRSQSLSHFVPVAVQAYEAPVSQTNTPPHLTAQIGHQRLAPRVNQYPQTSAELLEIAIRSANGHEQPLFPKPKRHLLKKHLLSKLRTA